MKKGVCLKRLVFIVAICFALNVNSQHEELASEVIASFKELIKKDSMSAKDFLLNSEQYSTFVKVLKTTNSFSILESDEKRIVFAPDNNAFAHFPSEVLKQLFLPENRHKLMDIANYHIVVSDMDLEAELDASNHKLYLNAKNGKLIHVELGSEEMLSIVDANGFPIDVGKKVLTSNGAIYPINEVLLPQVDVR